MAWCDSASVHRLTITLMTHQIKPLVSWLWILSIVFWCGSVKAQSTEHDVLITTARYEDGEIVPYMLTRINLSQARYALVLMPGRAGTLDPRLYEGKLVFQASQNFLIRSRALFADDQTVVASTDSTGSAERMSAIVRDLRSRYPNAAIYIIGTSRSTMSTMQLAERMDGQVTGFVHTGSMSSIATFDTRNLKSNHLLVHHINDACGLTGFSGALHNHEKFGTTLIAIKGGIASGDPCEAWGHHGFNGVEQETVSKIKEWVRMASKIKR